MSPDRTRTGIPRSEASVGYVKPRANGRFTALYELRPNVYRSAGTYDAAAAADDAWRDKERELRVGNFIDPAKMYPVAVVVVGVLGLLFLSTVYLDVVDPFKM